MDKGFYYIRDDQRYCRGDCEAVVKCGPVEIPSNHLKPCRSCSYDGLSCNSGEAGDGVREGHLLLYVSALQEQQCWSTSKFSISCVPRN